MQKEKLISDINYAFNEVEKLLSTTEEELHERKTGKWSRKEELGHVVDSAINNIKRFTEIQFKEKPLLVTSKMIWLLQMLTKNKTLKISFMFGKN